MTRERRDVHATAHGAQRASQDDARLEVSLEEVAALEVIELPERELLQTIVIGNVQANAVLFSTP